ncbi:MAG TPA: NMD3-related protein [Thermoplasmataceae archaeon]|nr:NMD3-related protein [Thermoplasmataceae archaeon]
MLCILCGSKEEYDRGICKDCIADKLSLSVNGTLDLTECPKCGSMKVGNKWYADNQQKVLAKKVNQMIGLNDPSFEKYVDSGDVMISHDGKNTFVRISLKKPDFSDIVHDVNIPTRRLRNSCLTCNKVTGSYYEAILQIRTLNSEYNSLVQYVKDEAVHIMRGLNRKDPESFISTVAKVPEGLDIYLGKRADGNRLAKHILDNYLSTMKVSKTLAGVKDGAKFYRFTYGVRLASLDRGSVISLNGSDYLVLGTGAAGLDVINTRNEKRTKISKSEFFSSDVRILEKNPRKSTFIVVSKEAGELQLMDKENYKMITMKGDTSQEEVELFNFDGKYYLPDRA